MMQAGGLTEGTKKDKMRFTGEPRPRTPKSLLNMPAKGERLQAIIEYLPKRDQRPERGQCPQVYRKAETTKTNPAKVAYGLTMSIEGRR